MPIVKADDILTRLISATDAVLERSTLGGDIELLSTEELLLFFQSMLSELVT